MQVGALSGGYSPLTGASPTAGLDHNTQKSATMGGDMGKFNPFS
jgi:hypothetical protein